MRISRKLISETVNFVRRLDREKMVHYRELYKEIDHTNFQISTKTDFKRVEKKNKGILKLWDRIKRESAENKNFQGFHKSKSGSQYIITKDGFIYRLSDHWGAVASCEWTLEGEGNLKERVFEKGPLEIGKAHLSDFTLFLRKNLARKDFVINPQWKEKMLKTEPVLTKLAILRAEETFRSRPVKDKIFIGESFGEINSRLKQIIN
jgi:hypothetical protein